ncbi:polyadenylate-binding protein-interacting protein 12-like [Andrographis paniculata]|uniref:polyadenylate-binding protein-interacting protein 12-like n=1 Tax=Andrographis paniculata TaxID=175694 RepID=UPI0021E92B6F|nr:polyadenylate-binding protein-interacting protein 12-like [Andrographis paniculata]
MAVVENAGVRATATASSNRDVQQNDVATDYHHHHSAKAAGNDQKSTKPADQNFHLGQQKLLNGRHQLEQQQQAVDGDGIPPETDEDGDVRGGEGFKREMRDLQEMLSKLNPMAAEFVPPSMGAVGMQRLLVSPPQVSAAAVAAAAAGLFGYNLNGFVMQQQANSGGLPNRGSFRKKKNGYSNGNRRMNSRTSMAQREDVIRRTVYVSDIDHQVTEEQLAALFIGCGQVVDCRVCGDPNSVLRFAFIEFTDEEGARNALSLAGTMLGYYPVRVLPSKTAIAPVNPTFLPRSEDEREMCARTIYCTNIDKKVTQADVKVFFETLCGEVHRLRLLGDYQHSTRIAFVEFVMAESAIAALNCSGIVLGSLPIRVSPSKTPVRPRGPRPSMH